MLVSPFCFLSLPGTHSDDKNGVRLIHREHNLLTDFQHALLSSQ
jgi:hypothetical protein